MHKIANEDKITIKMVPQTPDLDFSWIFYGNASPVNAFDLSRSLSKISLLLWPIAHTSKAHGP